MNAPLISVNIPAYNAEEFIERTIRSAINQTYQDIEVVILDDGSTDRTGDIIRQMQSKDNRIRYYYQDNGGLAFTRNRLFDLSKGEYIAFLDHDDEWYSDKLESQLALFKDNPDTALVYGDILNVYEDARRDSFRYFSNRHPQRGRIFYRFLIEGNLMAKENWSKLKPLTGLPEYHFSLGNIIANDKRFEVFSYGPEGENGEKKTWIHDGE